MLKVGVTGGIGSGKTVVCKIFESLSVPVYYADQEARRLSNYHPDIVSGVKRIFGENIYNERGLNRKMVGELAFKDEFLLAALNEIIHPIVALHFNQWLLRNEEASFVVKESAILFESGASESMDKVITVTSPSELRIERVMNRDGFGREEILSRMKCQMHEEERVKKADFVIKCDDVDLVIPQVIQLNNYLVAFVDK